MPKPTLYFLAGWGKHKQLAWSGTSWGLFCALQKLFDVKDIDVTTYTPFHVRVLRKFNPLVKPLGLQLVPPCSTDMGRREVCLGRQRALSAIKRGGKRDAVFQFSELVDERTCHMPTYLYIDFSVDAVADMREHSPEIFHVSNFQMDEPSDIIKRRGEQNEYMQKCAGIFTMGQWMADDLTQRCGLPPEKVHHVGGGINLDPTRIDGSQRKGNKFLFVGRDFERKNGPLVYEAFRLLHQNHPDWELHVAGPSTDPYPADCTGRYFCHGGCDHEALSALFNQCDVFVMPSLFEAYGLVFIEALAYGLPCIGRDAYEMPHFIEDGRTGLLLREQSPAALALLMEQAITTPAMAEEVALRRPAYLRDYTWDAVATRIARVIRHDIDGK